VLDFLLDSLLSWDVWQGICDIQVGIRGVVWCKVGFWFWKVGFWFWFWFWFLVGCLFWVGQDWSGSGIDLSRLADNHVDVSDGIEVNSGLSGGPVWRLEEGFGRGMFGCGRDLCLSLDSIVGWLGEFIRAMRCG
jgi:hypothetical protein